MSMDDTTVRLDSVDRARLIGWLQDAVGDVLVAVDDIDQALKVKVAGRWSPPIGLLTAAAPLADSARTAADDLAQEGRVVRPSWWGSRQDDRPDPAEYRGADR